jgi:formylglycine-generating enzyme required for sulfatase activity
VEDVSWENAQTVLKALTDLPKERAKKHLYRLPTEAEWEYACRGGPAAKDTVGPFYFRTAVPGLDSMLANFDGNYPYNTDKKGRYLKHTEAVGSYPMNPLGLCDMHGNVWEWCEDYYGPYKSLQTSKDPLQDKAQDKHGQRVLRGGSWNDNGWSCRAAYRYWDAPTYHNYLYGFRAVLVVP